MSDPPSVNYVPLEDGKGERGGSLFMCNIHSSISNFLIVLVIAIEMTNHYSQMHDSEEAFWV